MYNKDVHRLSWSPNQCNRVTDCLLLDDALPSYRNGVLSLNRYISKRLDADVPPPPCKREYYAIAYNNESVKQFMLFFQVLLLKKNSFAWLHMFFPV